MTKTKYPRDKADGIHKFFENKARRIHEFPGVKSPTKEKLNHNPMRKRTKERRKRPSDTKQ